MLESKEEGMDRASRPPIQAGMTRRRFLIGAAGVTATVALGTIAGCGAPQPAPQAAPKTAAPAAAKAGGEVIHMSWGGVYEENLYKAFFNPFYEETGIKVTALSPMDLAKVRAGGRAGRYEMDSFDANGLNLYIGRKEGLLSPIDWNVVGREGRSPQEYHEYGLAFQTLSTQLVYNPAKYPPGTGPESWADFWDVKKFPGTRAMYKVPYNTLEFALMADGVPPDKLYPLDVDRAFRSLDRIKPHIKVWWEQGNQSQQLFKDGEVDMMVMWNGRATDLRTKGTPIHQVWNQATLTHTYWLVTAGAPNKANAMRLVEFVGRARPQAEWAKIMWYGPLNEKAFEHIDDATARQLPTYPENLKGQVRLDTEWWGANLDAVNERFKAWLVS